jgi:hypothetical protein
MYTINGASFLQAKVNVLREVQSASRDELSALDRAFMGSFKEPAICRFLLEFLGEGALILIPRIP